MSFKNVEVTINILTRISLKTLENVYVVRCTSWYHLHNLKNVKNTLGGVLILVLMSVNDHCNGF